MPQMVWSATPQGVFNYFNVRMLEGTGLTLQQAIEGAFWLAVHPDDRAACKLKWDHSLSTGEPHEIEYRLQMANGTYCYMLRRVVAIWDAAGEIELWLATCTDISEIVAARQAKAMSFEQLEIMVAERTRDLEQSQAKLARSARLQALGQLVAGIAHDFNNVLHGVQGCSELIHRHAESPEKVRHYAGHISVATQRGSSITGRMLAFSRQSPLMQEAVDVGVLFDSLRDTLSSVLGTGIAIKTLNPDGSLALLADRGQLETVLVNLGTNARDAMSMTGTLEYTAALEIVDAQQTALPVDLTPGRYVRVSVRDTGTGMDAQTLARATEPFFTTKPVGSGTGLGLAMAHGFAEQSGGGLHIDSVLGVGTTIQMWFQEAQTDATPQIEEEFIFSRPSKADPHRVVLVDDDPIVLTMMQDQLSEAGYDVVAFENGTLALAHLRADKEVDGLISDFSMPTIDGMSLIREAQQIRPGLPAVLCTGFVNAAEVMKLNADSGIFRLIYKPASAAQIIKAFQTLLGSASEASCVALEPKRSPLGEICRPDDTRTMHSVAVSGRVVSC
jgi:PAS domain S-box-containing protein